jgi:hypothetical protein
MTREQILAQAEAQRAAYRSGCSYRRDGKKIERSTDTGWDVDRTFKYVNEAKRWSCSG